MENFQIQQKLKNKTIIQLSNKSIKHYLFGVGFLVLVTSFLLIYQGVVEMRNNILIVLLFFVLLLILFNLVIYGGDARIAGDKIYINKVIGKDFKVPLSDIKSFNSYVVNGTRWTNIKFNNGEFLDSVVILSTISSYSNDDVNPEEIIELAKNLFLK